MLADELSDDVLFYFLSVVDCFLVDTKPLFCWPFRRFGVRDEHDLELSTVKLVADDDLVPVAFERRTRLGY